MTWEHYGCGISEELIVNVTNAMVEHGYKDAGYQYVNIDDVS
jgi:alpha-galactosidase